MSTRILLLTRSLDYGGAERQLVELAKGLLQRKVRVRVVTFYGDGPLRADLDSAGVPVSVINKSGRWDVLPFLWRLLRLVKRENPDVLHSYLVTPNLVASVLRLFLRHTCIVWGVRSSDMHLTQYGKLVRFTFWLSTRLSHLADLIIVNSFAGYAYHVEHGYPKKRMLVIPNGIDTHLFVANQEGRQRLRAEWKVSEAEVLIGIVARFDPMKDHSTFLKAATLILKERNDVRFVCVGDGPTFYEQELKALARELGLANRVIWTGNCRDMPSVYSALDILTSSSVFGEGFPNVIGEAMSCGVPCVATNVGDSARIIGAAGEIVPPKEPEKLALGWLSLIEKMKSGLVSQAELRQRIDEKFSTRLLVERTLKGLQRCEFVN